MGRWHEEHIPLRAPKRPCTPRCFVFAAKQRRTRQQRVFDQSIEFSSRTGSATYLGRHFSPQKEDPIQDRRVHQGLRVGGCVTEGLQGGKRLSVLIAP